MAVELKQLIDKNTNRFEKIQKAVQDLRLQEKDNLIFERLKEHLELVAELQEELLEFAPPEKSVFERFLTTTLGKYRSDFENSIQTYHEPFSLFVVGNGNYGKSTLINSLMGEAVAEANILPKTWKVDFFRADLPENEVIIKYKDLTTKRMPVDEAKRLIDSEEKLRKESERKVKELLKKFNETKPDSRVVKEKERQLQIHHLYHSPIIEAHWPVNKNRFSSTFYVVDTPGLNQMIDGVVKASIKDYYHKADGVIWMLDATVISAKNSSKLLEEIHETINVVGESKGELIGILNRIDLIPTDEKQQQVIDEANRLFGEFFSAIIPYSSKLAFEGKRDDDAEKLTKSRSAFLEQKLFERFSVDRTALKIKSKEFSLHSYNKFLVTDTLEFLEQYKNYRGELLADHTSFQNELDTLKKGTERNIQDFVKSMTKKLSSNIANRGDIFFDMKDEHSRDVYLKDKLFEIDTINNEMKALKESFVSQLQLIEKRYLQKAVYTEFKYLEQHVKQHSTEYSTMNLDVGSSNYAVNSSEMNIGIGIAAAITAGAILGPLGMVVGGLAGWAFKHLQRGKLIKQLENQADTFVKGLSKDLLNFAKKNLEQVDLNVATNQFLSFSGLYDLHYFANDEKLFKEQQEKDAAFTELNMFEEIVLDWIDKVEEAAQYELSHPMSYIQGGKIEYGKSRI